jgi:hypothetical protein
MKVCNKCKETKDESEFYKGKKRPGGRQATCKDCCRKYREEHKKEVVEYKKRHYQQNKNKILEKNKEYREEHREEVVKQKKKYHEEHREEIAEYQKKYRDGHKEEIAEYRKENRDSILEQCKKYRIENKEEIAKHKKKYHEKNKEKIAKYNAEYYQENRDSILEQCKKYRIEHKEEIAEYYQKHKEEIFEYRKECYKNNEKFNIRLRLGHRVRQAFVSFSKTGKIRKADEYGIEYDKIIKHLGLCPGNLKDYHIDHIKPLCLFDFNDLEQIKQAFAPENHQWLTKEENLKKSSTYEEK